MSKNKHHHKEWEDEQNNASNEAGHALNAETEETPNKEEAAKSEGTAAADETNSATANAEVADADSGKSKDEEIAALKEELAAAKDSALRRMADFENYKKRMIKAQEDSRKFAIKDVALDIIEVNDNLLRAIDADASVVIEDEAARKAHEAFVQGVVMISKSIEAVLQKYGVEEIDALNQEFNPAFHEAVEIASNSDVDKDTVTTVYQKGFKMNDLVIRSARVKVTKPEKAAAAAEGQSESESE